ncbi:hypothetical protein [Helicobacter bizzozeronii]|uniref:hypothetical protein n=2 Tax=Helicobacter bizzozeronii TaxID=56877 RepID=UPI001F4682A1|nr:hypothetical protein [Helicobacter bizzozeronii]
MNNNTNTKAHYAKVQAFKNNLRNLISLERLMSYDNNIAKHDASLEFNAKLTPKIAQAEIYLRNIVDFCMQLVIGGSSWIMDEPCLNKEIEKINKRTSRDRLIQERVVYMQKNRLKDLQFLPAV